MPNVEPPDRLEWNEANLAKTIAELYAEADSDQSLRARLMTNPYEVLKERIDVPEGYRGSILAKPQNSRLLVLHVPEAGSGGEALPEGTSGAETKPAYELICTLPPLW